jgi:endonuclease/exonuclease/phosphatase family metal-dependent hydrolase
MAVIDSPEGPFHLVHFHLGLAEKERHWQLEHLLSHQLFRESDHLPSIIVGDFNDWRNTLCEGCLRERGFSQWTSPISRFRSFPAYLPLGSLDKAFVRGEIFLRQARIARSPIARHASDHLPLVIDFHLKDLLAKTGQQK